MFKEFNKLQKQFVYNFLPTFNIIFTEEKIDAARKRIEEKEVKAQQVLNKKKQKENELRLLVHY